VADGSRIEERPGGRFQLSPVLLFLLAPFLLCGCIAFMLLLLSGAVRLLIFVGLTGAPLLLVYGVMFVAVFPAAFFLAARIGRFLMGGRRGA
jgi:hypothetical protein